MTRTDSTFNVRGAGIYVAIVGAMTGLTVYAGHEKYEILYIGLIGPAVMLAEGVGLKESLLSTVVIAVVYFSLIFAPTGWQLQRGKWTVLLVIAQIVFFVPSLVTAFLALIFSGH